MLKQRIFGEELSIPHLRPSLVGVLPCGKECVFYLFLRRMKQKLRTGIDEKKNIIILFGDIEWNRRCYVWSFGLCCLFEQLASRYLYKVEIF